MQYIMVILRPKCSLHIHSNVFFIELFDSKHLYILFTQACNYKHASLTSKGRPGRKEHSARVLLFGTLINEKRVESCAGTFKAMCNSASIA